MKSDLEPTNIGEYAFFAIFVVSLIVLLVIATIDELLRR